MDKKQQRESMKKIIRAFRRNDRISTEIKEMIEGSAESFLWDRFFDDNTNQLAGLWEEFNDAEYKIKTESHDALDEAIYFVSQASKTFDYFKSVKRAIEFCLEVPQTIYG